MKTTLARRKVECVSDLTIDRWLLGETPGSDEARRLEEHMKGCSGCASRIGALRGLYSTQVPPAKQEPPVRLAAPPTATPQQTGAVQFLILRDGLLVGSEFFTPGSYAIGSDPRADLQLDGLMPLHARLYFRDGKVAVKAEAGTVLVSGFKVESCEVRSIDEVVVGPYVLRTRVIRERWSDVHVPVQLREVEPVTEVITLPAVAQRPFVPSEVEGPHASIEESRMRGGPSTSLGVNGRSAISPHPLGVNGSISPLAQTRLTAELWWGDTRQQAQSFSREVTAADFPLWGFGVADDFVLASPAPSGAFVVHAPGAGAAFTLERGQAHAFTAGALRLTVRVDEVLPALPRAKVEGWPVVLLSAVMMLALFLGSWLAPERDEEPFTPQTFRRYVVLVKPPAPEPKAPKDGPKGPKTAANDVKAPSRPRPPRQSAGAPPKDPLASLKQVLGDTRSLTSTLNAMKRATPGKRGSGSLFAGVGLPGGKPGNSLLGISSNEAGIGVRGLKNVGGLTGTGYGGSARIGGRVDRPSGDRIVTRAPPGSIDKDALARAILEHLSEVSRCYENAMTRNGESGGKLTLEWTVTTAGTVASARVKNSILKDGSIASCVLTALKGWRFPVARGGPVVVSYPFIFHASAY